MHQSGPNIDEIRAFAERLKGQVHRTPVLQCRAIEAALDNGTHVHAKLEFLQRTGTFKARGALANVLRLDSIARQRGVTAVSAGNHAIATAFAAKVVETSAKVVMISSASAARISACESYGAQLLMVDDPHEAFAVAERIQNDENRYFVHPFDGPAVALGTGTLGLEICEQISDFNVIVIPIGGGGLISGMANAIKQLRPEVRIIGVEPVGADTMHRSFASGRAEHIDKVATIADSLGAPFAMPYSFGLARENVDELVLVDDVQLRRAMGFLFNEMRIAVEPACAAATAALMGPLRESLRGQKVMLLMCGSNIDWATFSRQALFDYAV